LTMNYTDILPGFSGINRGVSNFDETVGEFVEGQNFATNKIGVLKKAGDYQIKGSQIAASQDVLGGIDFYRSSGSHDHLVAVNGATNAGIYKYTTSWASQSQALTKDYPVRFAYSPALDTLFAVNYADATRSFNGTAWSTSTNVTNAPKARYIIAFGERIYLLNCDVSGTAYPSRAYRSSLVDTGSITWDVVNDWVVFDDVIKGVGRNGENMFVGCENSSWIFTKADERYQVSATGCVSHESICDYGTWTFRAARDGIYAFDGGSDTKISLPIQEYWDAIPEASLSKIQAKVLGHHLYIYIGDITLEGRSLSNVLFDYNILQNNYNRMSLADEVKNLHSYVTSSGQRLFFGNDDGEIFQLFSSGSQNTAEFTSFVETRWFFGSGPQYQDDYYALWGHGEKLSGLSVFYKVDDSGWQPVGQLNGSTDFVKFHARGYRIKFLLQETSKNNLYELHRLLLEWQPSYKIEEDKQT